MAKKKKESKTINRRDPARFPLGSGLAARARQRLQNRGRRIDEAVDKATK